MRLEVVWVVSLKLGAASVEESVLLLPILEKKTKMVVLIGCCRRGGKRRSFRWRGINVVERVKDELGVAWLGVAESTVERECRERDLLQKKLGRRLVFSDFWTRFSPLSGHQIHLYL